jgi:FtsP/CotA-like multicopper oxidase with cupredoxin domain
MLTRRQFLTATAAAGGFLVLPKGIMARRASASAASDPVPGGSLDPRSIAKFVTPLVIPPVMPRSGTKTLRGGKNADWYRIAVRQFDQEIVPGLSTTVWGYGSVDAPGTFNYPSFTVEAKWRRPVAVQWRNELVDPNGHFLPHLLPVDPTLHWANPPGGPSGRDSRPVFDETPGAYTGPVPIVTHLHGAARVGDESDGYAEAWYLPRADDIPAGYAEVGTWYRFFKDKSSTRFGGEGLPRWSRGNAISVYPNDQRASTLWYHDHTLGMTRLNVYAGPAGFWILRGGPDDRVLDSATGLKAKLPGPAPRPGDKGNKRYREIPIVVQDRSFDEDGSLFYPDSRTFFDDAGPDYIPTTDVSPIWNPEFFGNVMVVNGKSWPFLRTERRRYRFRLLNGCDSRFLILAFDDPNVRVWQIGTEGGFLPAPLDLTALNGGRILLGLAERADVIVDFTDVTSDTVTMRNLGPDEPFGGGVPGEDFDVAHPGTTGRVMRFEMVAPVSVDDSTPPTRLVLPPIAPLMGGAARPLALLEGMSAFYEDSPSETLLGTVDTAAGTATSMMWEEPITENPAVGATEVWEFFNFTADAHPIHVHEVQFQVVDRQPISFEETEEMGGIGNVELAGPSRVPEPWEAGFKDTVIAYPGEVTRIRARFTTAGNYVWHCHIVSHEDNEMMRPYRVGPVQAGSPEALGT